jgi:hypothetical protein
MGHDGKRSPFPLHAWELTCTSGVSSAVVYSVMDAGSAALAHRIEKAEKVATAPRRNPLSLPVSFVFIRACCLTPNP